MKMVKGVIAVSLVAFLGLMGAVSMAEARYVGHGYHHGIARGYGGYRHYGGRYRHYGYGGYRRYGGGYHPHDSKPAPEAGQGQPEREDFENPVGFAGRAYGLQAHHAAKGISLVVDHLMGCHFAPAAGTVGSDEKDSATDRGQIQGMVQVLHRKIVAERTGQEPKRLHRSAVKEHLPDFMR